MTRDRLSGLLLSIGAVAVATSTVLTAVAAPGKPTGRRAHSPRDAVARVDAEMARRWKSARIEPAAPASDAEFLRRVTLDLAGRVPTAGEALAFLRDRSPRRRERLVDRLLVLARTLVDGFAVRLGDGHQADDTLRSWTRCPSSRRSA